MTIAGANCQVNIWRISVGDDDYVGGASQTGSIVYYGVPANVQAIPANQLLLQQGLETVRIFKALLPNTWDIRERDELQVVKPKDHVYYNNRFRIISVTYSGNNRRDPRNYMILEMTRSVEAHATQ